MLTGARRAGASWGRLGAKTKLLTLVLTLGVFAVGCSQGSYPLDIFYEMHYQQSFKSQEPPRLSGVESAVAWFPSPVNTSFGTDGQHLFEVNCVMCHGAGGKGDGPVVQKLISSYQYTPLINPPDLTDNSPASIEGMLQALSRPFGPASVMPPFGKLLNQEERAAIAQYVDSLPK
ncbi:MAG: cytochrome c [Chloroflexi bacterium]|nr:cytochrome c [Chloroflexota bacterium]